MLRKVLYTLVFLALTAEIQGETFDGKWGTFLTPIGTAIFTPSAMKVTIFDVALLAVLAVGISAQGPARLRAKPVIRALSTGLYAIGALWVWGVVRGGDVKQTIWQLHHFVLMFVASFAMIAICKKPKHLIELGKTVLYAGLWRAGVLLFYYVTVVRATMTERPAVMTTHSDTVLFVGCIVLVLSYAMERRTTKDSLFAAFCTSVFAVCIQLNNRRLAWVSLIGSILVLYAMLPKQRLKKRINSSVLALAPVILLYVGVGWGKTTGLFKPVGALSTMFGSHEDASSATRDIENYNLLQTLKSNPLLGTGWGHEYLEISRAYDISEFFKQYRFIPHNSVLGLLAFTGLAGFVATWIVLPVSAFFNARTYRFATTPVERTAAATSVAIVVVYANQLYGDMGMGSLTASVMMAAGVAVAARLSVSTGAWPGATVAKAPSAEGEPVRVAGR